MFKDEFIQMGRKENFSYEALNSLFGWYEELEQDTGEEIELDVIAICCDWTETQHDDLYKEYSHILDEDMELDEMIDAIEDEQGFVIRLSDSVLVQS